MGSKGWDFPRPFLYHVVGDFMAGWITLYAWFGTVRAFGTTGVYCRLGYPGRYFAVDL